MDLRNSFVYGESGLEGFFELDRLTKRPVQSCARTTGTGITSMQLDSVYDAVNRLSNRKTQFFRGLLLR